MPVWHEGTKEWVKDGKLVLLGITQEQHPERCRLFAQWKGIRWPILHDPINIMGSSAVPIFVAIDEHGIVRSIRPRLDRFEADFLNKSFADDTSLHQANQQTPTLPSGHPKSAFDQYQQRAEAEKTSVAWRTLGDVLTLWGGDGQINAALTAYSNAVRLAPNDGPAEFRLGVCYRRRYESSLRQLHDFQAAIDHWGRALEIDPNQYIWRRRIQQYGPRLEKPYSFYDWVEEAEKVIRARGEKPIQLAVRPDGAELAHPLRTFSEKKEASSPDPDGKIHRDDVGIVKAEVTNVPTRVRAGQTARIHITLRLDASKKAHWNNEAELLKIWIAPPACWRVSEQLLTAKPGTKVVSNEIRSLEFEVKVPEQVTGKVQIKAYALYNICDDVGGQCLFRRLDIPVDINIVK